MLSSAWLPMIGEPICTSVARKRPAIDASTEQATNAAITIRPVLHSEPARRRLVEADGPEREPRPRAVKPGVGEHREHDDADEGDRDEADGRRQRGDEVAVDRALRVVAQQQRDALEDAERAERGDDRGQLEHPDEHARWRSRWQQPTPTTASVPTNRTSDDLSGCIVNEAMTTHSVISAATETSKPPTSSAFVWPIETSASGIVASSRFSRL